MEQNPFDSFNYFDESPEDDSDNIKDDKKRRRPPAGSHEKQDDKKIEKQDDESGGSHEKISLLKKDVEKAKAAKEGESVPSEAEDSAEVPDSPEDISETELREISRQIIESHDQQLEAELAEAIPDSTQEVEVLSTALFIDSLATEVDEGKPLDDELLDSIVDEVARELDIEIPEEDVESPGTDVPNATSHEDDDTVTSTAGSASAAPLATPSSPTSTHTPYSPPPAPPRSAGRPVGAGGSAPTGVTMASGGATPTPHMNTHRLPFAEVSSNRYQRGADLLVGGIVGYLIGRRRGRIKTEARLAPVQKSLEKQVRDLNEKVTLREQKIRLLASEKMTREGEDMRRMVIEKAEAKARQKAEPKESDREPSTIPDSHPRPEEPVFTDEPKSEQAETPKSARQTEKIAGILISQAERQAVVTKEVVQTMPDMELLKIAASIEVDGQNAKQLYEQGRVSKDDLRAAATEQLVGQGRAARLLRERIRPLEIDRGTHERLASQQEPRHYSPGVPTQQPDPAVQPQAAGTTGSDVDISAVSEALIAQHAIEEHKPKNYVYVWVLIAFFGTLLLLGLFL